VTIVQPSLAAYQQLYNDHSDTLRCSCSQPSVPYGSFLNITFVLHQVCSSDFVSPTWLKYLTSFDPILLPPWTETPFSRDFRSIGAPYFQTLATFCSLAKSNIEDAQRMFTNTQFINDHVLAPPLFIQQTQAILNSFVINIQNDFGRIFNWINVTFSTGYLLTGANTNFAIIISDDDQLIINYVTYMILSQITHHAHASIISCTCPKDYKFCYRLPFLYTNTSTSDFDFKEVFRESFIGCTLLSGFLKSKFAWWYNESYLTDIQETYSLVIQPQSLPKIESLNASVSTQFQHNTLEDLFLKMFIETWIGNVTNFNQFYNECAPISCLYTVAQRQNGIILLFLFISICGSLNQILQILVPCIGKFIFFFIDWWKNRRTQHGT
jgi:hypothetical protein